MQGSSSTPNWEKYFRNTKMEEHCCLPKLELKVPNQENQTKKSRFSYQLTGEKKQFEKECEDEDEEKPSAPGDDLCPPETTSPPPLPSPSCSSAATEGIECRNAPLGPAKSCRREETSCQKLPSSSLEILPPETAENTVGGQNNGNTSPKKKYSNPLKSPLYIDYM